MAGRGHGAQGRAGFRLMKLEFRIRDALVPRERVLVEVGLRPGLKVLDFGCGSGSYTLPAARAVGSRGKVFAVDLNPYAAEAVRERARREGLTNVETLVSDCGTGLPDGCIDVVLLYDVFHDIEEPGRVLSELHRVLLPRGTLSFSDHHLREEDILAAVAGSGLFELRKKLKRTYAFSRKESAGGSGGRARRLPVPS